MNQCIYFSDPLVSSVKLIGSTSSSPLLWFYFSSPIINPNSRLSQLIHLPICLLLDCFTTLFILARLSPFCQASSVPKPHDSPSWYPVTANLPSRYHVTRNPFTLPTGFRASPVHHQYFIHLYSTPYCWEQLVTLIMSHCFSNNDSFNSHLKNLTFDFSGKNQSQLISALWLVTLSSLSFWIQPLFRIYYFLTVWQKPTPYVFPDIETLFQVHLIFAAYISAETFSFK